MDIPSEAIIEFLQGRRGDGDWAELDRWLEADPGNAILLEELRRAWEEAGPVVSRVPSAIPPTLSPHEIIRKAEAPELPAFPDGSPSAPPPFSAAPGDRRGPGGFLVAAALGGLLVGGAMLWALASGGLGGGVSEPFGAREFQTGPGEMVTLTMEDGSVVRLAPQTTLTIARERNSRQVLLDGEGFFAVVHDPVRPFVVTSGDGTVRVLGTRFNARARSGTLDVTVVEGELEVYGSDASVRVGPSERARITGGRDLSVERVDDVFEEIAWLGGFLALESSPMVTVAAELESRFGLRVVFEDDLVPARTMTGWFSGATASDLAAAVCRAVDAECAIQEGLLIMAAVRRP